MKAAQVAWLAAIIEGEGWIGFNISHYKAKAYSCPCVEVAMNDRDVIQRVAFLMDVHVLGPYRYGTHTKSHYQAQVYGKEAIRVIRLVLPWLGQRRTKQAQHALKWKGTSR